MSTKLVKILPDTPPMCAFNLRAEADLIRGIVDDPSPPDDPGCPKLGDDDLQRIAKTMLRAADLLDNPHA